MIFLLVGPKVGRLECLTYAGSDNERTQMASTRARLRHKGQVTLPPEVREALHVAEGDEVEFIVIAESGEVLLRGMRMIPADQAWFWAPEWQAGEREASRQIAAGELSGPFTDAKEMFADLLGDRQGPRSGADV
jgi:antitoxin PrlF